MTNHHGDLIGIAIREFDQSTVYPYLASRHCEGIGLLFFKNHEFPLRARQIDLGDTRDPLSDFLDHFIVGGIGGEGLLAFHSIKVPFGPFGQVLIRKHCGSASHSPEQGNE